MLLRYDDTLDRPVPSTTFKDSNSTTIPSKPPLLTCHLQFMRMSENPFEQLQVGPQGSSPLETFRKGLSRFFRDDNGDELKEQLRSAEKRLQETFERGELSLYGAFKEIIGTTALAQEIDRLFASEGGLDFYLLNKVVTFGMLISASKSVNPEVEEAIRRRKVQEIKRLMANEETKEMIEDVEALQITDGAGQGLEGEVEMS